VNKIVKEIHSAAKGLGNVKLMEVCGGHTNTIMRYGIRGILPENVKLVSGPGCPVCVTSQRDIDSMIELALNGVKIATYGDMVRVPGTKKSLQDARAEGADVQIIYSVDEINEKDRVFFGIGFETTAPMTAKLLGDGFTVFSSHKTMPNAMIALSKEMKIDGFIDPGHVSAITGSNKWKEMNLGVPQVICGFKPEMIMRTILLLLEQIRDGKREVVNDYSEVVFPEGNIAAQKLMNKTMKPSNTEWRGIGIIKDSGLNPRNEKLDARIKFENDLKKIKSVEHNGCRCGEVIRGLIEPKECALFGKTCTPEKPKGACMVSETEGACAISYRWDK